jgi:hypothetical protein
MHGIRWRVLLVSAVASFVAAPVGAKAWHSEEERLLEDTAYSLRAREGRIGLWRVGAGLTDRLSVETSPALWIAGAALGAVVPNMALTTVLYDDGVWTASVRAGVIHVGRPGQDVAASVFLMPVTAAVSHRFDARWSIHGRMTAVAAAGAATVQGDDLPFEGELVASMLHADTTVEVRVHRAWAFTLTLRYMPWHGPVAMASEVTTAEGSSANVRLNLAVRDLDHAYQVLTAVHGSFERFNFRLGVGVGDFFLGGGALVVPWRFVVVDAGVFVRFGARSERTEAKP